MWSSLKGARSLLPLSSSSLHLPPWKLGFSAPLHRSFCSSTSLNNNGISSSNNCRTPSVFLSLPEIEKVLRDVRAGDVKVISLGSDSSYADCMVLATGCSCWHVKNIAQALLFQTKEKQRGATRMVLPDVGGEEAGKWIVIDYGSIVVHAFDEDARAYYGLERLWTVEKYEREAPDEDLSKSIAKVRRINNSKKRVQSTSQPAS